MNIREMLEELAGNLYWTWQPRVIEVFRDFDPRLWREVNHNPVALLARLSDDRLQEQSSALALGARISRAVHEMHAYLASRRTWGERHAGVLRHGPVAYFSAEFGLHESLPLYSGGLGVLAGDHLKAASDLGVPLVGVGLFYLEGYFRQRIDESGWQQEEYNIADLNTLPLTPLNDGEGKRIVVSVRTKDDEIRAQVWTARVGRNRLLLLDSNVEGNSEENRSLTSTLYGGDQRTRIRQELLLGVAGTRLLEMLGICPSVLHINEGHSAFALLERARQIMKLEDRPFQDAAERVAADAVFTTHTPVASGHDRFSPELVEQTLGALREELRIPQHELMAMGRVRSDDDEEPFCMTVLGLRMANFRNAVSARHGQVSRSMWRDVWPSLPAELAPIGHITNGIHMPSWLAVPLSPLYSRALGDDWDEQSTHSEIWARIDRIDDEEFWEHHQVLKAHLINYVNRSLRQSEARRHGDEENHRPAEFRPEPLTLGFARRFASYKRADLLLGDRDRLKALLTNPDRPVQIIFAGKAHPADQAGKTLIREITRLMWSEDFAGRIVILEDHDMNVSRHLVQGADVWLNTPRRPMEACGTSGQKAVLNGGLNLSVLDGWWAQAYDGTNGFAIGCGSEHTNTERQDADDAEALFRTLEQEVVPMFYERDERNVPRRWVQRQKNAIRSLAWRFSARRMVIDYALRCYLPAAGGHTCFMPSFPA